MNRRGFLRIIASGLAAASAVGIPEVFLAPAKAVMFGDGSDGDLVLTGNMVLNRSMQYRNLTLKSKSVLVTQGHVIFVKGLVTMSMDSKIQGGP